MYAKSRFILAATLLLSLPAGCASFVSEGLGDTGSTSDSESGDGWESGSVGTDSVTESESESGSSSDMGSSSGDGDGDSDSIGTSASTGDGDGDGDGDSTSSSTAGDGDGDGDGGTGETRFPGDYCDPFLDTCLDQGGDYECSLDQEWLGGSDYETVFTCSVLNNSNPTPDPGGYGDTCMNDHSGCQTGYLCTASTVAWPNMECGGGIGQCCAGICFLGDMCANGPCNIQYWQAGLADYLDPYTGIGYCPGI